jgi:AcrR family transcriptional regulator
MPGHEPPRRLPGEPAREVRRRPRQDRSRHTVAVILEAAREIFDRLGYVRATTNLIAERAGVSIGSLYQYFPNKAALLAELAHEHHAEVHAVVAPALERLADRSVPLADSLRELLRDLIAIHAANPGLHRALANEVAHDKWGVRRRDEAEAFARKVGAALNQRPDVTVVDLGTAAHLVVQTVEGITRWLGHEAPGHVDRRAVVDELTTMLVGYLNPAGRAD